MSQHRLILLAILALWLGWLVSWIVAAGWSARTAKRPGILTQLPDRAITVAGAFLLAAPLHEPPALVHRLLRYDLVVAWLLVAGIAAGIAVAWWARLHLGRMWSGSVTQKEDHRIIKTGPYALVRHPIYSGILISIYSTAFLKDTGFAFIGAAVITLGFYLKARLEERFLSADLGAEYQAYRRRVPMLFPIIGV